MNPEWNSMKTAACKQARFENKRVDPSTGTHQLIDATRKEANLRHAMLHKGSNLLPRRPQITEMFLKFCGSAQGYLL